MNVKYKVLASISLQHEFYTDGLCPDFSVVPTPETEALLKNMGAVCKMSGSKLLVLVRADNQGKPFQAIPDNKSLVFYMMLENTGFFNFSNISYQPSAGQRYYFSNRLANRLASGALYLPVAIDMFDSGNVYEVGDLARALDGTISEAIKKTGDASWPLTTDLEYWAPKKGLSYAGKNDLVTFTSGIFNFAPVTPVKDFTINISRPLANTSWVGVGDTISLSYDTVQSSIQLSLSDLKLATGYYSINVNGTAVPVYYNADAVFRGVFGVIELFTSPTAGRYAFCDNTGSMQQPEYEIDIASRSVLWKYITSEKVVSIVDEKGAYNFDSAAVGDTSQYFTSTTPIPLTEKILPDLTLTLPSAVHILNLPSPSVNNLSHTTQAGSVYYCIEKYLIY